MLLGSTQDVVVSESFCCQVAPHLQTKLSLCCLLLPCCSCFCCNNNCCLQAGCVLDAGLIPLLVNHLTSQQVDIRTAAASALADAVAQHPDTTADSVAAVVALYGEDLEDDMDEARAAILLDDVERAAREAARQQQAATRAGVATALEALSGVLSGADVNAALDFLVNRGLAEPVDSIREAMVGAGECHGWLALAKWAYLLLGCQGW